MTPNLSESLQKIYGSSSLSDRPSSYSEANTPRKKLMDSAPQTACMCHQKHYSKDCSPRPLQPTNLGQHVLGIIHETREEPYITTEVDVKDNIVISEERVNVAAASSVKSHQRRAPSCGIRCTVRNITWDASSLEEPDVNASAFPKRSVDAAAVEVEVVAVGVGVGRRDAAAVVPVIGVAIRVQECISCCRAGNVDVAARI
jgi:hypothetical protein